MSGGLQIKFGFHSASPVYRSANAYSIHHSQSIPEIFVGSLAPHDSSHQPLHTARLNDDHLHAPVDWRDALSPVN
jgi:hypothetical protein